MTQGTLKKANEILKELEECESNLAIIERQIKHQLEYPLPPESPNFDCYISYGQQHWVMIPKDLYNTIAPMIKEEYEKRIAELQKEFDSL